MYSTRDIERINTKFLLLKLMGDILDNIPFESREYDEYYSTFEHSMTDVLKDIRTMRTNIETKLYEINETK